MSEANNLLTLQEVADELGIHIQTVRGLIRDGKLRQTKITQRNIRVHREDLADYLDAARGAE